MKNILEVAQENNLNLIEVGILVELNKNYPQTIEIEEVTNDGQVRENINNLIQIGFVEERFQKYRIKKRIPKKDPSTN
ncbi:hypothetical protein SAMN05216232_3926 [Virgibacillus subterraneus]|uniref:Uncharacterized protein n=1 Tax=Virgibacillus subterraneus TaxID=621109 RepID=A0A1H9KM36_9BACI|nr:hypothetical protein [Virgibacillus subterraneus]SER00231.1 hypothetical protein SAMN05216232_3926 [Virgibacillus subterraneus]